MARQVGMEITGTIGNVIFYERQGSYLLRTVQKQAEASKKAAKKFGQASSTAKILRQLLLPLLPNPKDRDMQNRLTPAMREFLSTISDNSSINPVSNPLAGFRFVGSSDLKHCLHFSIGIMQQADGNIHVEIPAINPYQSISAPEGTDRIELRLMSASFSTSKSLGSASMPGVLNIIYTDEMQPAESFILKKQADAGGIIVIAAALSYWKNERLISKVGYMPVEIVGVFNNT